MNLRAVSPSITALCAGKPLLQFRQVLMLAEPHQQQRRANAGHMPALETRHTQDVPGLEIAKTDLVLRAEHPARMLSPGERPQEPHLIVAEPVIGTEGL